MTTLDDHSHGPVAIRLDDLESSVGRTIGVSRSFAIDQSRVDQFAAVTSDRQWIHVDPERAAAGPYGATIAHGFLTLSFSSSVRTRPSTTDSTASVSRHRYRSGPPSWVRSLWRRQSPRGGGVEVCWRITIRGEGSDRPVCVADMVVRYLGAAQA